uniref:(northern house mosquito) hypothetical protein n=1 Tax=Culex pipiens TaxID=7175 RepID=A0A8D8A673_CULPI
MSTVRSWTGEEVLGGSRGHSCLPSQPVSHARSRIDAGRGLDKQEAGFVAPENLRHQSDGPNPQTETTEAGPEVARVHFCRLRRTRERVSVLRPAVTESLQQPRGPLHQRRRTGEAGGSTSRASGAAGLRTVRAADSKWFAESLRGNRRRRRERAGESRHGPCPGCRQQRRRVSRVRGNSWLSDRRDLRAPTAIIFKSSVVTGVEAQRSGAQTSRQVR